MRGPCCRLPVRRAADSSHSSVCAETGPQLTFCGAHMLKAIVSSGLAAFVWFWIRNNK